MQKKKIICEEKPLSSGVDKESPHKYKKKRVSEDPITYMTVSFIVELQIYRDSCKQIISVTRRPAKQRNILDDVLHYSFNTHPVEISRALFLSPVLEQVTNKKKERVYRQASSIIKFTLLKKLSLRE